MNVRTCRHLPRTPTQPPPSTWPSSAPQPFVADIHITQVTTFNNNTYPTNTTAPEFSVSWQYPQGPESQPVHAYPNIMLDGGALPAKLQDLSAVDVDVQWTYGPGNSSAASTNTAELTQNNLNANVAIDMFLDADSTQAQNPEKADYEVMIWFAAIGTATDPIGMSAGVVTTKIVNGTTLYVFFCPSFLSLFFPYSSNGVPLPGFGLPPRTSSRVFDPSQHPSLLFATSSRFANAEPSLLSRLAFAAPCTPDKTTWAKSS